MPDEISRTSGQQFITPHVSQHTSSHTAPPHSEQTPHTSHTSHTAHPSAHVPVPQSAPTVPLRVVIADDNPVVRAGLTVLLGGRDDIQVVAEAADGQQALEAAHQHRPDVILLDVRMPGVDGISALPYLVQAAPVMMLTYSRESDIVHEALRLGAGGYLVHGEFTADQLVAAVRDVKEGRAHFTATAANALLAQFRGGPGAGPGPGPGPAPGGHHLPDGLGAAYQVPPQPAVPPQPIVSTSWNPSESASHLQSNVAQSSGRFGPAPGIQPAVPQPARNKDEFGLSSREVEVMDLIASGMSNQQIAATCFISEKTVKNHINRIFAKLHSASRSEAIAVWLGTAHTGTGPERGAPGRG
ncbi:response regulator transcription factor [Streptomyces sp. FIT100]|uniref:response regulator transcription factor n=1 Tax=Streptomyces sp. FIT100 TaxID=2837956 RepID=UPI0021C8BFC4|nr:response regulator transcription factor [Streptomyces sp. FIT100]UUN28915.1 response regulator transcription factor [Streptomyces sp. FIT100]